MANLKQRFLAFSGVASIEIVYSSVLPQILTEKYLFLIPLVSAVFSPSAALPSFLLVFFFVLYRIGEFFYLVVLLPFLLLDSVKNIHDWMSALTLLLLPPLVIVFPDYVGVILGLLYYLSSKEKPHEAFFTSLIFTSTLFTFSLLFSTSSIFFTPLLALPGGLPRSTRGQLSDAVLFYSYLIGLFNSNPRLIVEFFILIITLTAPSISEDKKLGTLVLPQVFLLLVPLEMTGTLTPKDIFALAASIGTSLTLNGVEISTLKLPSYIYTLKSSVYKRRERRTKYDPSLIFWDLEPIVEAFRRLCEEPSPRKYLVVTGTSIEEEKLFTDYAIKDVNCKQKILFFHELGASGLRSLPRSETIIIYIRIPDKPFVLKLFSQVTGFDLETTEKLAAPYQTLLSRFSRTTLLNLALEVDAKIKEGYSARKAYTTVITTRNPEVSEDFIRILEEIYMEFEVIGFAR